MSVTADLFVRDDTSKRMKTNATLNGKTVNNIFLFRELDRPPGRKAK